MLHGSVMGHAGWILALAAGQRGPMSVLDDPNVENVVAVCGFVFTSRQPQTSPPLENVSDKFQCHLTTEECTRLQLSV